LAKRNPFAALAHGHDLAEAIVDAIREPLLVLDPDLRVIAASRSFYRTFAVTPRKTEGKLVFDLGGGQWNIPGLRALLEDVIPKRRTVDAYEVEHEFPAIGRRVMLLDARRVFDEDGAASAILLAIEDVTRRREADQEKDDLLRAKEILLQEMQHRVANSLQIIASIFCSRLGPCNRRKRVATSRRPTNASCRWQRCSSSCTPPGSTKGSRSGPI
jgi:chemotaxis protein methyltransferase CheR